MSQNGTARPPRLLLVLNHTASPCKLCQHVSPYMTITPDQDGTIQTAHAHARYKHVPIVIEEGDDIPGLSDHPLVPLSEHPELGEHVYNYSQRLRDLSRTIGDAIASCPEPTLADLLTSHGT